MPLVPDFRQAAIERELFDEDGRMTVEAAFHLVRDMPYQRASGPEPETVIAEWRGTCSSKHRLLQAILEEMGRSTMLMLATHEFTPANSPWLPADLLEEVRREPVPDVHTFLRVEGDNEEWFTVDATWPLPASTLGLPVNDEWVEGRNMHIAAEEIEVFDVPEDVDPVVAKERLLERHVGAPGTPARDRRERFIVQLGEWLTSTMHGEDEP